MRTIFGSSVRSAIFQRFPLTDNTSEFEFEQEQSIEKAVQR
jgi:hypothetical protein